MKTIRFEICYAKNPQIHQNGYVEIEDDGESPHSVEWIYYDQTGMEIPRMFTHHDGIGIDQIGATEEQLGELDDFLEQVQHTYVDYVDEFILLADEDENRTYTKGDLIIRINDGEW